MRSIVSLSAIVSFSLLLFSCSEGDSGQDLTRGIGVYPGSPSEYFGPTVGKGDGTYRNLALNREVHHSSSFDYNLTGHLITDGIVSDRMPRFTCVSTQDGPVERRSKERLFDDNTTGITVNGGAGAFLQFDIHNGVMDADAVKVSGSLTCDVDIDPGYDIKVETSTDGKTWTTIKEFKGNDFPGVPRMQGGQGGGSQNVSVSAGLRNSSLSPEMQQMYRRMMASRTFSYSVPIPEGTDPSSLRIVLGSPSVKEWTFQEMDFSKGGKEVSVLPSYDFVSAWMPEGTSDEWAVIDLGAESTFDKIVLHWLEKAESGSVEVSSDGKDWKKIASLDASADELKVNGRGRYVRLSGLKAPEGGRIILSEAQVFGEGGVSVQAAPQREPEGNRLYLCGGGWRLQRGSEVAQGGESLSREGVSTDGWIVATVPATVASSYYNIGAIPDIRYDDDQLQISESFFLSDFWYRDEFVLPEEFAGKDMVLNFDGINWKADVFLNGEGLGRIDGAFMRGRFDITSIAKPGTNVLAVKILKNDNPGIVKEQNRITADINGGVLGADNPTMHCSIGWDWIPTVRGRNIGIWNDVWIGAYEGGVSIDDVFVETDLPLPDTGTAVLKPTVTLTNHSASEKTAKVSLTYGDLPVEDTFTLAPGETSDLVLPPARMDNPRLWWPNGYGEQYLYDVSTTVTVDGRISDTKVQKSGIREMSYSTEGGVLDMYVNGRRLIGNGGNWGFPEINLNYRGREYDAAVRYHADMGYTMIRDWVGQTGDEEFYEACDRYGVTVWQDFWLANPVDGPDPDDNAMFLSNAEDYVRKIRNHPSIALYCGRNEGYPPKELDEGLAGIVSTLHPGLFYIPHSATGMVSGNGPYRALPVEEYFAAERGRDRFHSERGMPNVMTEESMRMMLREENLWPQTSVWGIHDYTLENAQSCATFNEMIEKAFGEPEDLHQFTSLAQWINYNGYRAMYESRSWERKGLLIWMSHSCWPSMVWQTYDYFFEPTAAYFGVKKGSAPIRIQWNPVSKNVEVVNNNAGDQSGLKATARVLTYDGKVLYEKEAALDSKEDSTTPLFPLSFDIEGITDVYYIKLILEKDGRTVADNFYWEGLEDGNYRQLNRLPNAKLSVRNALSEEDGTYKMAVTIKNTSSTPALMIRLKVSGKESGERILPVLYEDNYFSLLGGEEKTVTVSFKAEDSRGERPALELEGFNVKKMKR